jgi:hypothetical protein
MSRTSPTDFIKERLPPSRERVKALQHWIDVEVTFSRLLEWINVDVVKRWGKVTAARIWHILRTGYDCAVGSTAGGRAASEFETVKGQRVPGVPECCSNAFDAYQTLLWIAGGAKSVEKQETMTSEALPLVLPLLPEQSRK